MLVVASAFHAGTLPQWLTVASVVGIGWLMRRGAVGPALQYQQAANETLQREVDELKSKLAEERKQNAVLRSRTDLSPMQQSLVASIDELRSNIARDHSAILTVLDLIAQRLGPEANGHHSE